MAAVVAQTDLFVVRRGHPERQVRMALAEPEVPEEPVAQPVAP